MPPMMLGFWGWFVRELPGKSSITFKSNPQLYRGVLYLDRYDGRLLDLPLALGVLLEVGLVQTLLLEGGIATVDLAELVVLLDGRERGRSLVDLVVRVGLRTLGRNGADDER